MQSYENVSQFASLLCDIPPPFRANEAHIIFPSLRLALELMHQLPICTAHDVPGYSRIRGRYGILLRVCRSNICPGRFGDDLTHVCGS
jgi:hypothetical protein